jgi:hypothetical protein
MSYKPYKLGHRDRLASREGRSVSPDGTGVKTIGSATFFKSTPAIRKTWILPTNFTVYTRKLHVQLKGGVLPLNPAHLGELIKLQFKPPNTNKN